MVAAVRLRSAVALLGGFPVLAGADLDLERGQVALLQGANGAGKTSLLRTCAGLLPVVAGTAHVLGCDLTVDRRAVRRRVGMLGHANALYDDLTVEDNVRFAVRAAGGAVGAVEPALVRLGLAGRLRSVAAGRLSAGQRRRTALAALVARAPELWLLDEPHAGLDAEHRDLLDELIRSAARGGAAVLIASHEAERASAVADHTIVMAGGQVLPASTAAPLVAPAAASAADARDTAPFFPARDAAHVA
ncbi:MAG: type transport system ATP-binding protein [Acidimicrobiaceae bacterium]|jgi:heme ABC exporter ATP-binding subunit CcmA|nr:type transport system ATP-binding protein [Acidimicrobiaceae bacterium]